MTISSLGHKLAGHFKQIKARGNVMRYFAIVLMAGFFSVASAAEHKQAGKKEGAHHEVAARAQDDGYKCERQKRLGTNIYERVCTTKAQRDAARESAQKALSTSQR